MMIFLLYMPIPIHQFYINCCLKSNFRLYPFYIHHIHYIMYINCMYDVQINLKLKCSKQCQCETKKKIE